MEKAGNRVLLSKEPQRLGAVGAGIGTGAVQDQGVAKARFRPTPSGGAGRSRAEASSVRILAAGPGGAPRVLFLRCSLFMWKRLLVVMTIVTLATGLFLALAGRSSDAELLRRAREVAQAHRGPVSRPRYVTLIDYRRSILARRLAVVAGGRHRISAGSA